MADLRRDLLDLPEALGAPPAPDATPADLLQRALDAASNGIVIADATRPDHPVIYANPGFERLTGYSEDEVIGRNCRLLQGPETDPAAVAEMAGAVREGRPCRVTLRNHRRDGTAFWNEVFLSPVRDADQRLIQYVGVQNDVTERRRAEDQVAHLAYHDALTGLANRHGLQAELAPALQRAGRRGHAVALLYVDLDDFKAVNDRLGHLAGDELLRDAGARLRGVARAGDVLARQGGDEFLVALPGLGHEPEEVAAVVGERMVAVLREPFALRGQEIRIGASIGLSLFPRDAADVQSLLEHADTAMYAAKSAGRGRVAVYRPGDARPAVQARRPRGAAAVPRSVAEVLSAGAIEPVFQPIVALDSGAVLGYEALTRGPSGSPLQSPDRLFAAARAEGLLAELDAACRRRALERARAGGLLERGTLFVNAEPDALGGDALAEAAALGGRVVVEITERALTARPAELLRAVAGLRARGWGVALDDVGADVRSLALMPLLAPDVVKLDLRLVQQQPTTEVAEIVNAVRAHRDRTGAAVLAEGIETAEHLQMALAMGASLGQGWLFGRPGPLPAALPWTPRRVDVRRPAPPPPGDSPFEVVRAVLPLQRMTKPLLLAMSLHLEHQAMRLGPGAVVVAAFQGADRFTPATHARYARLAEQAAFVGALGVGMAPEPAPGVRGAQLRLDDPLLGEWSIAVVGPHFAGALVAQDLGDLGPDAERRFDFALTYDRDLVVAACAALLRRVAPVGSA